MKIEINKDVPMPTSGLSYGSKYPLHEMEIGDSFYLADISKRSSVSAMVCKIKAKKFVTRKEGIGFRCWRTQ